MRVRYSTKRIISLTLTALLLLYSLVPLRNVLASPSSETLRPNAVGDLTQLLPKASPNWGEVDEAVADGDTSYVEHDEGGTSGNYKADLYNLPDSSIPAGSTINNVTFYYTAKKIQVGTAIVTNARATFKTHGTTYVSVAYGLTTSYAEKSSIYTTNPNTTVAWTIAEINALQAGPSLQFQYVSDTRYSYARCTQFYVVIDYTAVSKAWHDVSSWTANLIARTWSSGTSWTENLQARIWATTSTFYITTGENDGDVYGWNVSYAIAHDVAKYAFDYYDDDTVGQYKYDLYYSVYRTFLKFDTSAIPFGATITNASLGLYGDPLYDYSDADFIVNLQKWTDDTPITLDDFNEFDGINYDDGNYNSSNFIKGSYNMITISNFELITESGNSLICVRSSKDISSTPPTQVELLSFMSYEEGHSPKLIVTWEIVAGFNLLPRLPAWNDIAKWLFSLPYSTGSGLLLIAVVIGVILTLGFVRLLGVRKRKTTQTSAEMLYRLSYRIRKKGSFQRWLCL